MSITYLANENERFFGRTVNPVAFERYAKLKEDAEALEGAPYIKAVHCEPPLNVSKNVHVNVDMQPSCLLIGERKDTILRMMELADHVTIIHADGFTRMAFTIMGYWEE